jgi:hypothetical protein
MNESLMVGMLAVRGTLRASGSSSVPLLWHALVVSVLSVGSVCHFRRDDNPDPVSAATAHHLREIPA